MFDPSNTLPQSEAEREARLQELGASVADYRLLVAAGLTAEEAYDTMLLTARVAAFFGVNTAESLAVAA